MHYALCICQWGMINKYSTMRIQTVTRDSQILVLAHRALIFICHSPHRCQNLGHLVVRTAVWDGPSHCRCIVHSGLPVMSGTCRGPCARLPPSVWVERARRKSVWNSRARYLFWGSLPSPLRYGDIDQSERGE